MEWKEVDGSHGDYLISSTGMVISLKNGKKKLLKPRLSPDGYLRYALRYDGRAHEVKAHRLVATHFVPNTMNKETVNHKDGNKTNNAVENLEWATRNEQMVHAYRLGLKRPMRGVMQAKHSLSEDMVRKMRNYYKPRDKKYGAPAMARKYHISLATVYRCVHGRSYQNVE